ncbi:MAG: hypothetical protein KDB00_05945 [Planctomycetales bacterium]|nr:hypothetical protein [Planctomycetales bacterium]
MHTQLIAVPLLLEWQTPKMCVPFEDILTMMRGGDVYISNQFFKRDDPVDYRFPGMHAYRAAGSYRLYLKTAGSYSEVFIFQYRYFPLGPTGWFQGGFGWLQLIPRIH